MSAVTRVVRASSFLVAFGCIISSAFAHDPGLSSASLWVSGETITARLTFARADIECLVPLDADHDGKVTSQEFQSARTKLEVLGTKALKLAVNHQPLSAKTSAAHLEIGDGVRFDLSYVTHGTRLSVSSELISRLARGHRQYLTVDDEQNRRLGEQMLDATHHRFDLELTFRSALKIITSFTLAHSLTLALATFNLIRLPSSIVEPLIAASIIYVGVENIFSSSMDKRWLLTFAFGLIHGCGFASALKEAGVGADGGGVVLPLFSFNLGVEFGQAAIAALVLPLIWKLKQAPHFAFRYAPACSILIVLAGSYWLVERVLPK